MWGLLCLTETSRYIHVRAHVAYATYFHNRDVSVLLKNTPEKTLARLGFGIQSRYGRRKD